MELLAGLNADILKNKPFTGCSQHVQPVYLCP